MRRTTSIAGVAIALSTALLAGCAGATRTADRKPVVPSTPSAPAAEAATETVRATPAVPVDVHTDAGGFTVETAQPITDAIRTEYASAVYLFEAGRVDASIAALEELTEVAPTLPSPYVALGVAYRHQDDLDRAAERLTRAIELSPDHPAAHNELGLVRRMQGEFEESRRSYEAALAGFSDYHYAHRNLAILCDLYLGDAACALEHYEAYRRLVPDDAEVEKWIVDLRRRTGMEADR